jgi:hypothetical protein
VFTLVAEKSPRAGMLWIPALCGIVALGIDAMPVSRASGSAIVAVLVALQAVVAVRTDWPRVRGIEAAARWAVATAPNRRVLYMGLHNADFIVDARRLAPARDFVVVRGCKVFEPVMIHKEFGDEQLVTSEDEILSFLRDYGITTVIVEDRNLLGLPAWDLLWATLHTDGFAVERTFPVEANLWRHEGLRLVAFRFLEEPTPRRADLPVQVLPLGRTLVPQLAVPPPAGRGSAW